MNAHELKQMQVRLTKLEAEIKEELEDIRLRQQALSHKQNTANRLQAEINALLEGQKEPVISEHALVRYFERVKGFDLEEVKEHILTDKVKGLIAQLGNGTYPVDGFKIKVQNNTVVTIF